MKRILLAASLLALASTTKAQFVNNSTIHVSEGAVMSIGTSVTNKGEINNNGKLHLKGDLQNEAKVASKGTVVLDGNKQQTVSGNAIEIARMTVENDVRLQTPVKITEEVEFRKGIVSADAPIAFGDNAIHNNASDASHVVGTVQKSGNGTFEFPLGDGQSLKSFEADVAKDARLEAKYVGTSPLNVSKSLDYDVENINETEYWTLKSDAVNPVKVTLGDKSEMAALKSGVWVKNGGTLNAVNTATFTSGKGKDIVKAIGVWPNPTQGEFNLKLTGMRDTDKIDVDITNQDGRVIMRMKGTVKELRKAYVLPGGLVATNLTVRVINGDEAMTQTLALQK